jgi:quinoprotein glucose dehydrogenase
MNNPMRRRVRAWCTAAVAIIGVAVAWRSAIAREQTGAARGEWTTYGGDLGHTRYAPLDQITPANFASLDVAWRFKTESLGPQPEFQFEATPLMVGGVVYSTAGSRRAVVALDAETGELLWMHSEQEGERGEVAPRRLSGRGLAYWTDGKLARIVYVTPGYRMLALDARTGERVRDFGTGGVVDLKQGMDQAIDPLSPEIGLHATPTIARDVIIVGAAHKSGGVPTGKSNVKGYVRGFDVRTGKRLWIFRTIPQPGEFGADTWLEGSASYSGNTGVWTQISVDEQLGLVYLPVESTTGDYYGGHRPGANLLADSLVAVDLRTGIRKWHFQFIHHGLWDMDLACAPILADITVGGRAIKAVAVPTKQAFLYVFNRETGEPVWPIEERPVEKGDVPREWYSPTQPFPTRPPAYDRQGLQVDDLIDFTPELRAEAVQLVSRYKIGPIFTPPVVSKAGGPLATLAMATAGGGTNWPGGSFDPETQVLYVSSSKTVSQLGLVPPDPKKNDMLYVQGNAATGARTAPGAGSGPTPGPGAAAGGEGGGGGLTVRGLPLVKPPYGTISAIDLSKGDILWQIAHGETPAAIRNHPDLKGLAIPRTGRLGTVGTLVTKTLLIAGEAGFGPTPSGQRGAMLRAYDKASGREVGAVYIPAPQGGSPMTYLWKGRQYLVIAVSGAGYPGELIAFRLPA